MCLNAIAAAAAESSDLPMPLKRISRTEGSIETPLDAESSHFEYAPIVKQTEIILVNQKVRNKPISSSASNERYLKIITTLIGC